MYASSKVQILLVRGDDGGVLSHTLLELILVQEACLASSVTHEDASFLGALDKALVVATDAISDCYKTEILGVKNIAVLGSELQQTLCETVVVLLLLKRVVQGRVTKVLLAVGNEELLEFREVL